jgi:hypothetical protein
VQLAKAARLAPQVVLLGKSAVLVPPKEMALIVKGELRLLVSFKNFAGLVLATATLPKVRLEGASVACTAEFPKMGNNCGEFLALS